MLYNIVRAANKFEKINKKVGDISLQNVIINDDGQIKVISTCSLPNELDNFQKVVEDINARVYLGIFLITQPLRNSTQMLLTKVNILTTLIFAELKFSVLESQF